MYYHTFTSCCVSNNPESNTVFVIADDQVYIMLYLNVVHNYFTLLEFKLVYIFRILQLKFSSSLFTLFHSTKNWFRHDITIVNCVSLILYIRLIEIYII